MAIGQRVTGRAALPVLGKVFTGLALLGLLAVSALINVEAHSGKTAQADGVITEFRRKEYPLVQFTDDKGNINTFRSSVRSSMWTTGTHLPVAYNPSAPADAALDGFAGRWFLPTLFGIFSGVFLLVGVAFLVFGR